ncbi:MAG TPA: SulP family inorganic anion transporter [Euzebyales bacterium]|nr:SulP family inorganic anion transporter [Euzebyales bacterium]
MRTNRPLPWLAGYRWRQWLGADLLAGVALAALVIPESVGYAQVAGLPPEVGLFAAPLALVGYALVGASRLAAVATASAVSAVSASVVGNVAGGDTAAFVALSAALAIASGLVYLVVGLARMGWIANFMSQPVLEGFIIGLALFIIAGQVDGLVGVETAGEFALARLASWLARVAGWDPLTMAVGVLALGMLFGLHRWLPKVPGALVVLVLGMGAVAAFDLDGRGVEVVGELPTGLPTLGWPDVDAGAMLALVPGALAVTLVGFSEGFAAVNAFKADDDGAIDVDRDLVAFGTANVGAGLSSGMVVGASLSKTAAVAGAGGRSQVANIAAAGVVVAALLVIGPVFAYLPEAVLAAVVIHAVWGLVRFDKLRFLRRVDRFDWGMAVLVLAGTLVLEPIYAVLLGVSASVLHLVQRVSFPHRAQLGLDPSAGRPVDLGSHPEARPYPGVVVYRMDAPLLFVNAAAFRAGLDDAIADADDQPSGIVVDCESMFTADATGIEVLAQVVADLGNRGIDLRLARVRDDVLQRFTAGGIVEVIGPARIHDRVDDAVAAVTPHSGDRAVRG